MRDFTFYNNFAFFAPKAAAVDSEMTFNKVFWEEEEIVLFLA